MKYKASDITFTTVTVLGIAALIAAAYGGCISPGNGAFVIPSLVILLPVITAIALIWLCVLLITHRWRNAIAIAAVLLTATPTLWLVCPVNLTKPDTDGKQTITLLTYNVAVLYPHFKHDPSPAMRKILDVNADIVMMQEVPHHIVTGHYETSQTLETYLDEMNAKYPYRSQNDDDIVIMSKYPFTMKTIAKPIIGTDPNGEFYKIWHHYVLAFDVKIGGEDITFVNAHLQSYGLTNSIRRILKSDSLEVPAPIPPEIPVGKSSRLQMLSEAFALRGAQAREVRSWLDHAPANLILCGDFNDTAGSYAYRTLRGNDMNDAFSETGLGPVNTFGKYFMYFKIDHVLYRGCMRAVSSYVDKSVNVSDHYPLVTKFVITNKTK